MISNEEIKQINSVLIKFANENKSNQAGLIAAETNIYLDWNFLMGIVEVLEQEYDICFTIELHSCTTEDSSPDGDVFIHEGDSTYEAVYRACYHAISNPTYF